MKTSKDIRNFANYIFLSCQKIKAQTNNNVFFIPFFRKTTSELFKKSIIISSIYLNITSFTNFSNFSSNSKKTYSFKSKTLLPKTTNNINSFMPIGNTVLAQLVEDSTKISKDTIESISKTLNNEIINEKTHSINYEFLNNYITNEVFSNKKDVINEPGGFIPYEKL